MVENNLDVLINKISYIVAKEAKENKVQNHLEKLLGILINDGVYAYFVYCKAQKKQKQKNKNNKNSKQNEENIKEEQDKINDVEKIFVEKIIKFKDGESLIKAMGLSEEKTTQDFFEKLPQNLDNLLLFRSVLERILTYARYHLKAMEDNGGKSE